MITHSCNILNHTPVVTGSESGSINTCASPRPHRLKPGIHGPTRRDSTRFMSLRVGLHRVASDRNVYSLN